MNNLALPTLKINSDHAHEYFSGGLNEIVETSMDTNVAISLERPTSRSEIQTMPWVIMRQKRYVRYFLKTGFQFAFV